MSVDDALLAKAWLLGIFGLAEGLFYLRVSSLVPTEGLSALVFAAAVWVRGLVRFQRLSISLKLTLLVLFVHVSMTMKWWHKPPALASAFRASVTEELLFRGVVFGRFVSHAPNYPILSNAAQAFLFGKKPVIEKPKLPSY